MIDIAAQRLVLLDGLRGIAAVAVMLYHAEGVFGHIGPFWRGYLFVDFFFLLSGFVLTLSAERRMNAGWSAAGFLRARIRRLWPLTAVGVALGSLAMVRTSPGEDIAALAILGLAMLPAVIAAGQIFPLNGPQWSLFLELVANLAHALVLRRLSERGLLIAVVISGLMLAGTVAHFGSNTLGPFAMNWWWALPRLAFSYTLGVWIARTWAATPHRSIASWQIALALPPLGVVALGGLPFSVAVGDMLAVMVLFPLGFWIAALADPPPGWVREGLARIGALSFPIYAVHMPVLTLCAQFGRSRPAMAAAAVAVIGVAWLIARTIESVSRRRPPAQAPQAQTA